MTKQAFLHFSIRALAVSSALLFVGTANAGWGVSIGVPLQTQYNSYSSSTVYGAPGAQIISTRQVPQTVCQPAWPGANTQQCSTQYVTVDDGYVEQAPVYVQPAPVYIAPAPVYIAPAPIYVAPSYGYGYGYNPYRREHHGYNNYRNGHDGYRNENNHYNRAPSRTYVQPTYGIGSAGYYGGGSLNIQLNGR